MTFYWFIIRNSFSSSEVRGQVSDSTVSWLGKITQISFFRPVTIHSLINYLMPQNNYFYNRLILKTTFHAKMAENAVFSLSDRFVRRFVALKQDISRRLLGLWESREVIHYFSGIFYNYVNITRLSDEYWSWYNCQLRPEII